MGWLLKWGVVHCWLIMFIHWLRTRWLVAVHLTSSLWFDNWMINRITGRVNWTWGSHLPIGPLTSWDRAYTVVSDRIHHCFTCIPKWPSTSFVSNLSNRLICESLTIWITRCWNLNWVIVLRHLMSAHRPIIHLNSWSNWPRFNGTSR